MIRRVLRTTALSIAVVAVMAACTDHTPAIGPEETGVTSRASLDPAARPGPNRGDINRAVPGFGGVFIDEQGRPTVFLKDIGQRGAVQRELAGFLREQGMSPADIQVRQGDFEYIELDRWFDRIWRDALAVEGAVLAGVSETHNRVMVGVENLAVAPQIQGMAESRGVPAAALHIEQMEPILPLQALQQVVNPIVGGVQINFPGFLCTLGFNALHAAGESWITNSHCTDTQGTMTGTVYRQPLTSVDPTIVGVEVDDPAYVGGGNCPVGRVCRFSDAARVRREGEPDRTFARGNVAKLQTTFSATSPIVGHFQITDKLSQPAPGQNCPVIGTVIHKVGRTTGWTHGTVSSSCSNVNVGGTNITLFHQVLVSTASSGVGGGDSGSPVFFRQGVDPNVNVTLHGILWGGSGSTLFVYSPMVNVEAELGGLTVTSDGSPPPPGNEAPEVSWVHPTNGQTVGGDIAIEIQAVDDSDSGADLTVEWRVVVPGGRGGPQPGPWQPASHAGGDLFTSTWQAADGSYTLDARATDSEGATSVIASIGVTVDNDVEPPPPPPPPGELTVAWVNPTNGQNVSGTVAIQLEASSDVDEAADLTVEWRAVPLSGRGGGTPGPWQSATHAGGNLFTSTWTAANGNYRLDARASDSAATTPIVSIDVTMTGGGGGRP
jgi:hypothetical protein